MALCFVKIAARYLFDYSIGGADSWSDELITYSMIASTMMCFVTAMADRSLLSMDIVYKRMTGVAKRVTDMGIWIISLVTCVLVLFSSWTDVRLMMSAGSVSYSSQMPLYLTHSLLFLGFAGCIIVLLYTAKRYFK
jgi:TRAP-type C4-dicarboxylate transport system permease small subunit